MSLVFFQTSSDAAMGGCSQIFDGIEVATGFRFILVSTYGSRFSIFRSLVSVLKWFRTEEGGREGDMYRIIDHGFRDLSK